jgi:hypothetical protein
MNLTNLLIGLEFGDGGGRGGVDGVPYVEPNRLPSHASVFSFLLSYLVSLTKSCYWLVSHTRPRRPV